MTLKTAAHTDETVAIARRWRSLPGTVTGALLESQNKFGYLSEETLSVLSRELEVPLTQLFSMATFFAFFRLSPRGANHVQVCQGTACHVRGAEHLTAKIERDLDLGSDGLSPDLAFSLETVRCLGCCSLAPVVKINQQTYGRVRQKDLGRLLEPFGRVSYEDREQ